MIIAAIAVGLLCAYHFGFRAGAVAAGATFALLIASVVMPGSALKIYVAIAAGVIGICLVGPRVSRDEARPVKRALRAAIRAGRLMYRRLRKRD